MQKMTVGRMAKLYGLHRSSLYEAIDKGRVAYSVDGKGQRVIDLSEMIRVYGEPKGQALQNQTPSAGADHSTPTVETATLQPLLEELRLLRAEVAQLRQAMMLLEHKPAPDSAPPRRPEQPAPKSFADLLGGLD